MKKEKQVDIVKHKLWRFGYSVIDTNFWSQRIGANIDEGQDLLVTSDLGKIKIKVGSKNRESINRLGLDFDVYVEVISAKRTMFIKKGASQELIISKSPYLILGRPIKK